jgi:hypothetical protein
MAAATTLAGLLTQLAAPIAKRVFATLGLAVVTYVGVSQGLEAALSAAAAGFAGLPAGVTQMVALSGVFDGLSIVAGAMVARVAMTPLKRIIPDGS